jgi:hypothetical protein
VLRAGLRPFRCSRLEVATRLRSQSGAARTASVWAPSLHPAPFRSSATVSNYVDPPALPTASPGQYEAVQWQSIYVPSCVGHSPSASQS